jgi:hypothetical protein
MIFTDPDYRLDLGRNYLSDNYIAIYALKQLNSIDLYNIR